MLKRHSYLQKIELHKFLFHIAQLLLYSIAVNLIITATLFIFDKSITASLFPLSFCIAVLLLSIFYDGEIKPSALLLEVITTILIFYVLISFWGSFYDVSGDGNAYHKVAIGLLKNGWNPLKELPYGSVVTEIMGTDGSSIWVEGYAKAAWIFSASIYAITNNIETGKIHTILVMICVFGLTYSCLLRLEKKFSFWFALIAALNPVAVAQVGTFYVDGFLHLILYIVILSLILIAFPTLKIKVESSIPLKTSISLLFSSMIICGNIKFTGLLYGGFFCIIYYIWIFLHKHHRWKYGIMFALLALI